MTRTLVLAVALLTLCSCAQTPQEICQHVCDNVILPEQHALDFRDADRLAPAHIPPSAPPRTVSALQPDTTEWPMALDEAIRIALENSFVVRVLAGTSATSSGRTIYDAAITNTTIDQERARFDPIFSQDNLWSRTNTPGAIFDPFDPNRALFSSIPTDAYRSTLGLTKTNVLGGQWGLHWTENPTRFATPIRFPLNPQNPDAIELSYTQPLLQGAGFKVNTAPIVIARLNTEQSFFQYKDSVQELVRGVVQAYWNLVQARVDVSARGIQVDLSRETLTRARDFLKQGMPGFDLGTVSQARLTYSQFQASLVAAKAAVLTQEGALRNLLGLTPNDHREIVPVSAPANQRLSPDWDDLIRIAEQRRPDIIELKLVTEADRVRLLQAENNTLPKLDASVLYRWNGLSGTMPNGEHLESRAGQFTDWSIGVNFSVPLGFRQGRAQVREQKLPITRDQANVEQQIHLAIHDLASTVRELDSAFAQYIAYKDTREAADVNVRAQDAKFRAGRGIYLNVQQALTDWGNAVSSESQQLLAYNVALANLERETGTILETHGLVFSEERFRAAGPLGILGHDRLYPSSMSAVGEPHRYPGTGEPSENVFDLKNPAPREGKPKLEELRPKP